MELLVVPLGLLLLCVPLGALLGWIAFYRIGALSGDVRGLQLRLDQLRREIEELAPPAAEPEAPEAPEAAPEEAAAAETPEEAPPPEPEPVPPEQVAPPAAPPPAPWKVDWEEALTSRWLVWLGAVTLALGGLFLVKYSIDQGLLGPSVRILLGVLLGAGLIVAGEWLRRRPLERRLAAVAPSYVPPALASAGIVTLFASVYAAHALYDMLPALAAFLLLAAIAALAVLLAPLHGPFMALIGIVGGFVIPALVSTGSRSAEGLFPYLLLLLAGALAIVRYMAWWWLAWVTLAGAVLWTLVWYLLAWEASDVYILGPFLLLTGALFVLLRYASGPPLQVLPGLFAPHRMAPPERIAWAALATIAPLLFILVRMDNAGAASLVCLGLAAALVGVLARREPVFDGLPVLALGTVLLTVLFWHLPRLISERAPMYVLDGQAVGLVAGPMLPPELVPFLLTCALYAALFAGGGFIALWGARRPALWASLSAAAPLLLLAIAYWRIERFEIDLAWTVAALLLAGLLVLAAERVGRHREAPGMAGALAAYAVGTVAALALAATTALENAWLTVALAALLPAIAWIEARLDLPALRRLAMLLAAVVLVRLLLNPEVLEYPLGGVPGFNWLLYGYGLPALAFHAAARLFRRRGDDATVTLLEAGALAFFVLLLTLEIRSLVHDGPIDLWEYPLAEQALQSLAWLAVAYALYHAHGGLGRPVAVWGWRILGGLALAQVLVLQLLYSNPLITDDPVGAWPVLNLMALAYGAPLAFALLFLARARRAGDRPVTVAAGLTAFVLSFAWTILEVRHAFQGSRIGDGEVGDGEWYAYSLAMLVYAGLLLALGLWRRFRMLRHASLAIVIVAIAKVFLFDMSALSGIYRALSFIGLGLALVGVGWLYRRFVFPPPLPTTPPPQAAQ